MDKHEEQEIKKEFQLERVILFSDAVFAIIITIMVLDIKLPEGFRHADAKVVKHALVELIPKFLAYALSFFLVAKFWLSHLKLFSLLRDYDTKLLAYNLLFLFSVTLFPFAISLISGNISISSQQYAWGAYTYVSVILFSTLTQTLISRYLIKHGQRLCFTPHELDKVLKYRAMKKNFIVIPLFVAVLIGLNYFVLPPVFAVYALSIYGFTMARFFKKYYPAHHDDGPVLYRLFARLKNKSLKKPADAELADKQ